MIVNRLVTSFVILMAVASCNQKKSADAENIPTNGISKDVKYSPKKEDSTTGKTEREKTKNPGKKQSSTWQIADGTSIIFTINNFGTPVEGSISGLKGTIEFDPHNPESGKFNVTLPVRSIKTGIKKRDDDIMHEKYLDADKYPVITFRSGTIKKAGNGYVATGELTIKGKTVNKELPFSFNENGSSGVFASKFSINRLDFRIGGNGPIMGKEISIVANVKVSH